MSPVIYKYCVQYHAFADKYKEADLKTKHKDLPIKDLKKAVKQPKIANNNVQEMNFVSRQYRYMVDKKNKSNGIGRRDLQEIGCDKNIKENFWGCEIGISKATQHSFSIQ